MMNWQGLHKHWIEQTDDSIEVSERTAWFFLLLKSYFQMERKDYLIYAQEELSESQLRMVQNALERLHKHEPIQYILGEVDFCGLSFSISLAALIPRPETEELVHLVAEKSGLGLKVLDIGTGSGCIPLALKHLRPDLEIHAIDISADAIDLATTNAKNLNLEVGFFEESIFKLDSWEVKYDVIISNPPYIPISEASTMDKRVRDHEPEIALFVENEDPLIFYRTILEKDFLTRRGAKYFFEIHSSLSRDIEKLVSSKEFVAWCLIKDQFDRDRILFI